MIIQPNGEFSLGIRTFQILNMNLTTDNKYFKIMYKVDVYADKLMGSGAYDAEQDFENYCRLTEAERLIAELPQSRAQSKGCVRVQFLLKSLYFEKFNSLVEFLKQEKEWSTQEKEIYNTEHPYNISTDFYVNSKIEKVLATIETQDSWQIAKGNCEGE